MHNGCFLKKIFEIVIAIYMNKSLRDKILAYPYHQSMVKLLS
jgi:hypothetical protein